MQGVEEHKEEKPEWHLACESGNLPSLASEFPSIADVNQWETSDHETALQVAARCGHVEICQTLVERGAQLNPNNDHPNPVHLAAQHGHIKVIDYFFKLKRGRGEDRKLDSWQQKTPLHMAAQAGQLETVKFLTKLDPLDKPFPFAYNNETESISTPLALAIFNGHWDVFQYLFDFCEPYTDTSIKPYSLTPAGLEILVFHAITGYAIHLKQCGETSSSHLPSSQSDYPNIIAVLMLTLQEGRPGTAMTFQNMTLQKLLNDHPLESSGRRLPPIYGFLRSTLARTLGIDIPASTDPQHAPQLDPEFLLTTLLLNSHQLRLITVLLDHRLISYLPPDQVLMRVMQNPKTPRIILDGLIDHWKKTFPHQVTHRFPNFINTLLNTLRPSTAPSAFVPVFLLIKEMHQENQELQDNWVRLLMRLLRTEALNLTDQIACREILRAQFLKRTRYTPHFFKWQKNGQKGLSIQSIPTTEAARAQLQELQALTSDTFLKDALTPLLPLLNWAAQDQQSDALWTALLPLIKTLFLDTSISRSLVIEFLNLIPTLIEALWALEMASSEEKQTNLWTPLLALLSRDISCQNARITTAKEWLSTLNPPYQAAFNNTIQTLPQRFVGIPQIQDISRFIKGYLDEYLQTPGIISERPLALLQEPNVPSADRLAHLNFIRGLETFIPDTRSHTLEQVLSIDHFILSCFKKFEAYLQQQQIIPSIGSELQLRTHAQHEAFNRELTSWFGLKSRDQALEQICGLTEPFRMRWSAWLVHLFASLYQNHAIIDRQTLEDIDHQIRLIAQASSNAQSDSGSDADSDAGSDEDSDAGFDAGFDARPELDTSRPISWHDRWVYAAEHGSLFEKLAYVLTPQESLSDDAKTAAGAGLLTAWIEMEGLHPQLITLLMLMLSDIACCLREQKSNPDTYDGLNVRHLFPTDLHFYIQCMAQLARHPMRSPQLRKSYETILKDIWTASLPLMPANPIPESHSATQTALTAQQLDHMMQQPTAGRDPTL